MSVVLPDPVDNPTALATVAVSALGVPRYWFHLAGAAGFLLDQLTARRALEPDLTALHIGTLGLVVEPMAMPSAARSSPGGWNAAWDATTWQIRPGCGPLALPPPGWHQ